MNVVFVVEELLILSVVVDPELVLWISVVFVLEMIQNVKAVLIQMQSTMITQSLEIGLQWESVMAATMDSNMMKIYGQQCCAEDNIANLCGQEGILSNLYYR